MAAGKGGGSAVAPAGLNLLLCEAEEREPVLQRELDTDSAQNQERLRKAHFPKTCGAMAGIKTPFPSAGASLFQRGLRGTGCST